MRFGHYQGDKLQEKNVTVSITSTGHQDHTSTESQKLPERRERDLVSRESKKGERRGQEYKVRVIAYNTYRHKHTHTEGIIMYVCLRMW